MIDTLMTIPIIMIDGDIDEKNQSLGIQADVEIIHGEADVHFYDLTAVVDRWLPLEGSYENAKLGKFDACGVSFSEAGSFIVPWDKAKFRREYSKFIKGLSEETRSKYGIK
jgi:hypothetical protein